MPLSFNSTIINSEDEKLVELDCQNQGNDALDFISSGVACYALTLLDSLKLIDKIQEKGVLTSNDLGKYNKRVVQGALNQLFRSKILENHNNRWKFSDKGNQILRYRGMMQLIYGGYSSVLASQEKKALKKDCSHEINYSAIASGSDYFGNDFVDNIMLHELDLLAFEGAICDLGCGDGTRLIKICDYLDIDGMGIELSEEGVALAKALTKKHDRIQIAQGDATKIRKVYKDIEVLTQFFVLHDFSPASKVEQIMNSYLKSFPNLKYFIYCDTVATEIDTTNEHPGFDYIHNLLGIEPMSYSEVIKMFKKSDFSIRKEVPIPNLPNTYAWILIPNK